MVSPSGTDESAHRNRTFLLLAVAVVAAVLAVPTGAFAVSAPAPGRATSTHLTATTLTQVASGMHAPLLKSPAPRAGTDSSGAAVQGAIASLGLGGGPAHGLAEQCVASSSVSAHCALPAHAPVPAAPHPGVAAVGWQNATYGSQFFFGGPAAGYGATMAWDAFDGYLVYYGGCSVVCPSNETWVYSFGAWFNLTNYANTPPGVYDASMAFDPTVNYVVLFGGCGVIVCPMNETWEFRSGTWFNVSAPFCFIGCLWAPSPREGASMVFANDSADNITVLFGGCTAIFCLGTSNETWEWFGALAAWIPLSTPAAPSPRGFAAMTSIPSSGVLLFGGCTGLFGTCSLNDTWYFENGTWTNETSYLQVFGFANPPGRAEATLEYDNALGFAILSGGANDTRYLNDSWAWACPFFCGWYNISSSLDLPNPLYLAASPSETGSYPPVIQGGVCECQPATFLSSGSTWVYEPQLTVTTSISPLVGPARSAVTFNATPSGGTPGYLGYWALGDGSFSPPNGTHNFTLPGSYYAMLWDWDYWGVTVTANATVTILSLAATAVATPSMTDLGATVAFSSTAPAGGTAPYNYSWQFGDGTLGYGATAPHAYNSTGTFQANLTLTDVHGVQTNSSVNVTVVAGPSVTFTASATTVDAGMSVSFTPTPSGGVSPYTYLWSFGDAGTATSASPSHTFASAGTFHVNVTVTDAVGVTATHSLVITVNPALGASATVSAASATTGTSLWFNATASGGTPAYTYSWVFGDAGHAATASASHAFTTAGTYTARVWVNDSLGQSVEKSVTVTVTTSGGGGTSGTSGSLPSWLWYVVIGVIVLAVVVALVLVLRRRGKPSGATAPPSGATGGAPPSGASGGATPPPPSGSS